jgi:transmembrane sensor
MSDRSTHLGLADSEAISARAAELIVEQQTGEWGVSDEAALAAWLAESSAHRIAYWKLEAAWDRTQRVAALKPMRRGARLAEMGRRVWPVLSRTAAAFALVCAGGAAAFYYSHRPPQEQTYATTVGGHEPLALDDGSRIELNTDTSIRIAMTGKSRKVWLDRGEAYFDVRHDAARPFVVVAGNARVTDLGTKFTVRREEKRLNVSLIEGRAELENGELGDNARSAVLKPGDVAVATSDTVAVTRKRDQVLKDALGWRRGVLVFEDTELSAAAQEFNRYNRKKVIVADTHTAHLRIGGTFPSTNVDAFADAAEAILGLHVRYRGNDIVISR